jgi:hypothetical protein
MSENKAIGLICGERRHRHKAGGLVEEGKGHRKEGANDREGVIHADSDARALDWAIVYWEGVGYFVSVDAPPDRKIARYVGAAVNPKTLQNLIEKREGRPAIMTHTVRNMVWRPAWVTVPCLNLGLAERSDFQLVLERSGKPIFMRE